jgi:hypothetical protein
MAWPGSVPPALAPHRRRPRRGSSALVAKAARRLGITLAPEKRSASITLHLQDAYATLG